jgi:fatty-acyl-CoA synthase
VPHQSIDILRRVDAYDVTLIDDAPAVDITVLGAGASWEGPVPGRNRVRVVLSGPPPPTMERLEAELGWTFVSVSGLTEPAPVAAASELGAAELGPSAAGLAAGG